MTDDFDWDAYLRLAAAALRLSIRPEWIPAVTANLAATAAFAEFIRLFPLPDDIEPAPVFEA